jgi:hypothetical protein
VRIISTKTGNARDPSFLGEIHYENPNTAEKSWHQFIGKHILMQSSLEKLRKFFRLERENGYSNTAVIDRLANVLNLWEGEVRNDKLPEKSVQAI